jgi:DNA-binding MarR family transcriptional regulator
MYPGIMVGNEHPEAAVELAMVAIRRRQQRRLLAARALGEEGAQAGAAITEVLDVVEENETAERPTTVTELARSLGVDQPRASKLVNLAVAAGQLRRVDDPADGRRSLLRLTDSGRAHLAQVHDFRQSVFAAAMATWTDEERTTFATLITRFVSGLN